MAIIVNPKFELKTTGTDIIQRDIIENVIVDTKFETTMLIQSTNNEIEIDVSIVKNKKIFIIYGEYDFTLHLYKEITSPLNEIFDYSFDIPIKKGLGFIINTTDTFFEGLKKITVSTSSVNTIKLCIGCYGEQISI